MFYAVGRDHSMHLSVQVEHTTGKARQAGGRSKKLVHNIVLSAYETELKNGQSNLHC